MEVRIKRHDLFIAHREFVNKYPELKDDAYDILQDNLYELKVSIVDSNTAYLNLKDQQDILVRSKCTNE